MSDPSPPRPEMALADAATLRPVSIDELSSVRHLHAGSVRQLAAGHLSEGELGAFAHYVRSERYADRLIEAVQNGRLVAAELMGSVVATAGWVAANDAGATVRLMAVFVSPLYAHKGLGRLVVDATEAEARRAGYSTFTVRAPIGSIGFFERLGYDVSSHGVWPLPPEQAVPVGFLRKVIAKAPR